MTLAAEAPVRKYKVKDPETGELVGTGAELRTVPIDIIKIDSGYQRDLRMQDVRAMAANWSAQLCGAIILSSRAGGPYCIDGGHRIAGAREAGITHLPAFVISGLTKKDEARLFVAYQEKRRGHTSIGKFKANSVAEDPTTLSIIRIAHNAGYVISGSSEPNSIRAINSLERIHRLGGASLLADVLSLVKGIWFGERKGTDGQLLFGLATFLVSSRDKPQFDHARLERVMTERAPLRVLREAQAIAADRQSASTSSSNIAEALIRFYDADLADPSRKLTTLHIGKKRRPAPAGNR